MSCNNFSKVPNPVPICQKIYGKMNVNDVRDASVNSIRRFYGWMCNINSDNIGDIIQNYMVKILIDSGRNPKAVKLSIPPSILEPSIFPKYYIKTNYNKDEAFKLSIEECKCFTPAISEKNILNCYIDYNSV
jgi:hypothetical protein